MIKGIIYDFDGTIVSTEKLHAQAWVEAGKRLGIGITPQMLISQKGLPDEEGALIMIPLNRKSLLSRFIEAKRRNVLTLLNQAAFNSGFLETWKILEKKNLLVWICTSSHQDFINQALTLFPQLSALKPKMVWREKYFHSKPSPDILQVTLEKMRLLPEECVLVGDAYCDYQTAIAAAVSFIYFCPDENDNRIPPTIPRIHYHRELLKML